MNELRQRLLKYQNTLEKMEKDFLKEYPFFDGYVNNSRIKAYLLKVIDNGLGLIDKAQENGIIE
jgi:hypothetical protein